MVGYSPSRALKPKATDEYQRLGNMKPEIQGPSAQTGLPEALVSDAGAFRTLVLEPQETPLPALKRLYASPTSPLASPGPWP